MSEFEPADFQIVEELPSLEHRRIFRATQPGEPNNVRLTVFSAELSQRPEFRRALKTDRAMLSMLRHQSIVRFGDSGESGGQLFFWTEPCEFESLATQLEKHRVFSSEDVIEIGWQVCSALQQAHNLGLAHGGLSMESVLLSDNLQVMLIDFGVARWLKAAAVNNDVENSGPALITISALASREQVESDLTELASILGTLLKSSVDTHEGADSEKVSTYGPLERLLARITSGNPAMKPVSAREFQGRLGEILIGSDDDKMPLVDHREFTGGSKRSIVVELFDSTETENPVSGTANQPATSATRMQLLPILVGLAVVIILALLAGLLR